MNQDLQCQVNGGQSAFIGVYVMNEGGFRSTHNTIGYNMSSCYNLSAKQCSSYSLLYNCIMLCASFRLEGVLYRLISEHIVSQPTCVHARIL